MDVTQFTWRDGGVGDHFSLGGWTLLDPGIDLSPVGEGWRGFFKWILNPIPAKSEGCETFSVSDPLHILAARDVRDPCRQAQAAEGMHNADVHRTRHRGRDWPDVVSRRDVEVGAPTIADLKTAATSPDVVTVGQGKSASAK